MRLGAALALSLASASWAAPRLSFELPARQGLLAFCSSAVRTLNIVLPRVADPEMADLLAKRAAAGVKVRLILDPGFKSNRRAAGAFRQAKFKVRWLGGAKPGSLGVRLLLADGARLLTGGFEATPDSLDSRLESLLECDDAALVGAASGRFEALWERAKTKVEDALALGDALEGLGDPRGDEERTPRIKRRSNKAP